jgi:hypothetical protein
MNPLEEVQKALKGTSCTTYARKSNVSHKTELEITFTTFPITVIGNHDFLPIK